MWISLLMWKNHIKAELGPVPKFTAIWVDFLYVEPDQRRDPDNIAAVKKLILDCLVDIGSIQRDGWKQIAGWSDRFQVDKKPFNDVGVWLAITEMG